MFHLALFGILHSAAVSQVIGTHIVLRAEAAASALYFENCYAHVGSAMNNDQGARRLALYMHLEIRALKAGLMCSEISLRCCSCDHIV